MNRYYNPVRTLEGPGSLSSLPEILNGMESDSGESSFWYGARRF